MKLSAGENVANTPEHDCWMVLSSMAIAESELEIDGKRRVRGHAKLKSRGTTGQ